MSDWRDNSRAIQAHLRGYDTVVMGGREIHYIRCECSTSVDVTRIPIDLDVEQQTVKCLFCLRRYSVKRTARGVETTRVNEVERRTT